MTPLLETIDVAGGYTSADILRGVSISVGEHEVVGVLGSNGAGKTSLLRAISGTLPRCRGRVLFDGVSLERKSPWSRVRTGVAQVPEGRHIFGAMTVRENLEVAGLVAGASDGLDRVFELFPKLGDRQQQLAGRMSGGEQQMLAIGRALMSDPRVLVIDEMSAGLAPVLVHQLLEGLVALRKTGLAVLLVEQSPYLIADVVDRVYMLSQGAVAMAGTLAELGGTDRLAELYLGA